MFFPDDEDAGLDEAKIYDDTEESGSGSRIQILFVPFVESNQLALVFDNKDDDSGDSDPVFQFPNIKRSTFIDHEENIMALIDGKY
jgi:hypothetical protein